MKASMFASGAPRRSARGKLGTRTIVLVPIAMVLMAGSAHSAAGSAHSAAGSAHSRGVTLSQLLEAYWREFILAHPRLALSYGNAPNQDQFDDSLEDGWREHYLKTLARFRAALEAIVPNAGSDDERISIAMLERQLAEQQQFYGSALFEIARRLPIDQFQGPHLAFAADAAGSGDYPFKTVADYEESLRRADRYAQWTEDAVMRLREGVRVGQVLPKLVVERILPQLRAQFGAPAAGTEFWQPVLNMPSDFSPADRARLTALFRWKIERVIEPAYERLFNFLHDIYLPHARTSVGLDAMPGGPALYDYDVRFHTTLKLSPEEIHDTGLGEVARLEDELAQLESQLGFTGTLTEFLARVRDDADLKFADRAEIVPAYRAAAARIKSRLPALFGHLPRATFEIRALPDSAQHSQANGSYAPAGADGSRPGILWINTFAPGLADRFNVMTISLHEGLPGHHLQTSLALENLGLPSFRRFDFTNAYGEGWALYAESLGNELHVFDDPWSHFGYLSYAILRANRLVIDTGLHALGWSAEQGVDWMMQHSAMNREQSAAEVERYIAFPGQALSYKIGELKLRELRNRAQSKLGDRFDLEAFHDAVLLGGSMPLQILEAKIDRWIARQAGSPFRSSAAVSSREGS